MRVVVKTFPLKYLCINKLYHQETLSSINTRTRVRQGAHIHVMNFWRLSWTPTSRRIFGRIKVPCSISQHAHATHRMFHFENIFRLQTTPQRFEQLFLFKLGMNCSAQAFGVEARKFDNRSLLNIAFTAKTFKITRGKYRVTQKSLRQLGMNGSLQSFWGLKNGSFTSTKCKTLSSKPCKTTKGKCSITPKPKCSP